MEDGGAEAIKEGRHARATRVVVAGQFQKVGIPRGLRKVLFGSIERAERHVLLNVESEWLLRSKGLSCSIQFRSDLVVAVGPERLPAQDFRILKQQPPEGDEVAIRGPLIVSRGSAASSAARCCCSPSGCRWARPSC